MHNFCFHFILFVLKSVDVVGKNCTQQKSASLSDSLDIYGQSCSDQKMTIIFFVKNQKLIALYFKLGPLQLSWLKNQLRIELGRSVTELWPF